MIYYKFSQCFIVASYKELVTGEVIKEVESVTLSEVAAERLIKVEQRFKEDVIEDSNGEIKNIVYKIEESHIVYSEEEIENIEEL